MDNLTPEQIKQMIQMLQSMLPKDVSKAEEAEDEFVSTIKTKKVSAKKSNFKNKFNDMAEKNMHKEDIEIDKKLHTADPTPRRKNNALTEAQCRVCGKKEIINAGLIIDKNRFKCNDCSAGAG
jgi:hypothetical protein